MLCVPAWNNVVTGLKRIQINVSGKWQCETIRDIRKWCQLFEFCFERQWLGNGAITLFKNLCSCTRNVYRMAEWMNVGRILRKPDWKFHGLWALLALFNLAVRKTLLEWPSQNKVQAFQMLSWCMPNWYICAFLCRPTNKQMWLPCGSSMQTCTTVV